MKEEYKFWKETLNNYYEISNYGNVKINGEIFEDFKMSPTGYKMIAGKFLHRIVAELFIDNPENKPQIDHIDGNKLNNRADNLQWVTQSENQKNPVTVNRWRKKAEIYYSNPDNRNKRSKQFKSMWDNADDNFKNSFSSKQSKAHKNKTYVHNENSVEYIHKSDLLTYLENGYIYGKYPNDNKNLRVYKDNHLTQIKRIDLLEYLHNGWSLYKK